MTPLKTPHHVEMDKFPQCLLFVFQAVSLICVPKVTLSFFSSKLYCFSVLNAKIVFSVS